MDIQSSQSKSFSAPIGCRKGYMQKETSTTNTLSTAPTTSLVSLQGTGRAGYIRN